MARLSSLLISIFQFYFILDTIRKLLIGSHELQTLKKCMIILIFNKNQEHCYTFSPIEDWNPLGIDVILTLLRSTAYKKISISCLRNQFGCFFLLRSEGFFDFRTGYQKTYNNRVFFCLNTYFQSYE